MNFIALAIVAALVVAWMWGRSEVIRRGGWRVGAGLLAVVLTVAGAVVSIKGDWMVGLPMVLAALLTAAGGRMNRGAFGLGPRPTEGPSPPPPRPGP
jgi:hypothetical protein